MCSAFLQSCWISPTPVSLPCSVTTLPRSRRKLWKNWEALTASLSCSETARNVTEMFAKYLQLSERTDFLLRIIEGMQDFSIYNKQLVGSVVAGIREESSHWLVDGRKMKVLLPDLLEVLEQGNEHVQLKALRVCRNVLRELRREEVIPMAVELLDKLLPLFDNELFSELREISISLFTELLKKVAGKCKRQMKKRVRRGLLPLFFHMSDDTRSVAEASSQALLAAAELLKWQQLQDLVKTEQTWRIGECLLLQDRTRADDYLDQSQGYLDNAQDTLRMEAIRFIGLAARGQSQQKLSEMMSTLYPLEHDCTPSIRCLATQTISILSTLRVKAERRRTKRPWCC
ncbi:maestro heat-like repeat family member 5 isoform X2 [Calypte anna]|uniref:maestro heat-like repeat family member 5 isoform X2 n=1 Tax=Calypte anna TaxID=9244 RepID=UPI0011C43F41|nr:maestro heat-like repeat family member 5 isoform X2 [Calypte anna]